MTYWVAGAAAVGAIIDNKNPLRGAALGAGTALTGGAALGVAGGAAAGGAAAGAGAAGAGAAGASGAGLLGGAGAAGASGTGLTLGGVSAAGGSALPGLSLAGTTGATGTGLTLSGVSAPASTGLLDSLSGAGTQAMGYLDSANKVLKPVGQAASAANAVQSMLPQSQPVTTPPPQFGGGAGSQAFNGLLQDSMATEQARLQEEMKKREAQQKLIGLIGGR